MKKFLKPFLLFLVGAVLFLGPSIARAGQNLPTEKLDKKTITSSLDKLIKNYSSLLGSDLNKLINTGQKIGSGERLGVEDVIGAVNALSSSPGEKKTVYLTFDDGPNEPYTSRVLDILDQEGIKATFFVLGKNLEKFPKTLEKVKARGHAIGNHSYSHSLLTSLTGLNTEKEIEKTTKLIKAITGEGTTFYRPPFGTLTPEAKEYVDKNGYKVVLASVMGYDWKNISPKEIEDYVIKKTRPGSIIVLHDGRGIQGGNSENTVDSVRSIIKNLKKKGYNFEKITSSTDTRINLSRLESLIIH